MDERFLRRADDAAMPERCRARVLMPPLYLYAMRCCRASPGRCRRRFAADAAAEIARRYVLMALQMP